MSLDAELAIGRLIARYADVATRMAWDEMLTLTTPDATFSFTFGSGKPIVLDGPQALATFGAQACASFAFYNYTPLNHVAELTGEADATGRAYALEVGVDRASGSWIEFYGRYDDTYAIQDGEWRFASRRFRTVATRTDGDTAVEPT